MARFLLILPLLASLHHLIHPIDGAIERGKSAKKSDRSQSIKDVLAQTGGTAVLPCRYNGPGIVTWVRRKDKQQLLLTVGRSTHSPDTRFVVMSSPDWNLMIKNVKHEDAGLYECQIQTEPVQQRFVRLNITEAYSVIPGGPNLHVKQGSSLCLECQLMAAAESPSYVFWYRDERMINYDNEPGVNIELRRNGSVLVVKKVKLSHGANYTCSPNNARPAHIIIHVIEEEEKPAAMHGGDRRSSAIVTSSNTVLTFMALLIISDVRRCFQKLVYHAT